MGDTTAAEAAPPKAGLADEASEKGSWAELFRGGHALYSMLIIGGIALNATQVLVRDCPISCVSESRGFNL